MSKTTTATAPVATETSVFNLPSPGSSVGTPQDPIFNLPVGTQTFAYPATPTDNSPNSPGYNQGNGGQSENSNNIPMIVGITIGGVVVIAVLGLLIQRYRVRSREATINSHQTRSRNKPNQVGGNGHLSEEERGDRAKLAKSFTIRKPPSVYVEDDQDLNQTGHPQYKSASDAYNHPYYGERSPGLVEYELSDTSGQKYGPASIAERKRYVEQQQRKVMEEYEMFNPHKDVPPPSPYPPSQAAPSYTSNPRSPTMTPSMTPSMGGRSPRVHNPSQSPLPYGRPMQQDNDYQY
ncbi:hypothetical protein BGZ76_005661 [Entomortierella beljakovae]|nr:hypothetical protein BGZ76_005661 [Entomortierella beljakovae]